MSGERSFNAKQYRVIGQTWGTEEGLPSLTLTCFVDQFPGLVLLLHPSGHPKMTFLATSVCSLICS